jgi:hypothetical protein
MIMSTDPGDTQALPPRPIAVLQLELDGLVTRAQTVVTTLETLQGRAATLEGSLDAAAASSARIDTAIGAASDRITAATTTITTGADTLQTAAAHVDQAASHAQRLADHLAIDGAIEPTSARALALQQGPAWVLGTAVLALAFYLVYARITSPGPWVAIAVGLVMAVALTFRTRIDSGNRSTATSRDQPS